MLKTFSLLETDERVSVCPADGVYPNYYNCSTFITCSNGIQYVMACPEGLIWNVDTNACDWPYNTKCTWCLSTEYQFRQVASNKNKNRPSKVTIDFFFIMCGRIERYRLLGCRRGPLYINQHLLLPGSKFSFWIKKSKKIQNFPPVVYF